MAELNIPDEAQIRAERAVAPYALSGPDTVTAVEAALEVAAPLIVAAEIADDVGLEVLRETAARVNSDSDAMSLVGAVLRYVDDRRRRASELRGEG